MVDKTKLLGQKFGRLEVISFDSISKNGHTKWLCRCECGKETVKFATNLRKAHTQSCGCLQIERSQEALSEWRENFVPDDEIGKKYGRVTVESFAGWIQPEGRASRVSTWNTICQCGTKVVKRREALQDHSSCGCWFSEKLAEARTTHGMSGTPTHMSWRKMIERCYSESYVEKEHYQDRGILVCEKWHKFEGFYEDMGERPEGMTLDRIDGNLGYYKENCRWATLGVQAFNRKMNWNNSSGRTGVYLLPNGLYKAMIGFENENILLINNTSFEKACQVRAEAELKYYGWNKE